MPHILERVLARCYDWLACADSSEDSDVIFVLAGRQSRKLYALDMFARGRAPELLLSIGRFEVRDSDSLHCSAQLNLRPVAAKLAPRDRHFLAWFGPAKNHVELMPTGWLGTMSEIRALGSWLRARSGLHTALIVSSGFHLRRVRMCCAAWLSAPIRFRVIAGDVEEPWFCRDSWWRDSKTRAIVLSEFPKLLLYWVVLRVRWAAGRGAS